MRVLFVVAALALPSLAVSQVTRDQAASVAQHYSACYLDVFTQVDELTTWSTTQNAYLGSYHVRPDLLEGLVAEAQDVYCFSVTGFLKQLQTCLSAGLDMEDAFGYTDASRAKNQAIGEYNHYAALFTSIGWWMDGDRTAEPAFTNACVAYFNPPPPATGEPAPEVALPRPIPRSAGSISRELRVR